MASVGGLPAGRPIRADNWVSRQIDGETVLVPIRAGAADLQFLFVLNATASWVWSHLDGRHAVPDLARGLTTEFQVPLEQAEQDVKALLGSLAELALIRDEPGRPGQQGLSNP